MEVYSETIWEESLDLFLNLVSVKQIFQLFEQQAGLSIDFMNELRTFVENDGEPDPQKK